MGLSTMASMRWVVMLAALPGLFTFVSAGSTVSQLLESPADVGALRSLDSPSENISQILHFRTDLMTQPVSGIFSRFSLSDSSTILYYELRHGVQNVRAPLQKLMISTLTEVVNGHAQQALIPSSTTAEFFVVCFSCEAVMILGLLYMVKHYLTEDKGSRDPDDMCETPPMLQMTSMWPKTFWLLIWLASGVSMVLLNSWLFSPTGGDCPYPLTLTFFHQFVLYIAAVCLRHSPLGPELMPAVSRYGSFGGLSYLEYMTLIAPQGLLLGMGFAMGNSAFVFLSIALIHMMKVLSPLLQYGLAALTGLEEFTWKTAMLGALMTVCGVIMFRGEITGDVCGIVIQLLSTFALAGRTILLKKTLSVSNIDVISSLYLVSPSICIFLFLPAFQLEWNAYEGNMTDTAAKIYVYGHFFLISAGIAVVLNVSHTIFLKSIAASSLAACVLSRDVGIMMIALLFTKGMPDRLTAVSAVSLVACVTMFIRGRTPAVKLPTSAVPDASSVARPLLKKNARLNQNNNYGSQSTASSEGPEEVAIAEAQRSE